MESTGKFFVTMWNNHAIKLPLFRLGADIVPAGFGSDYIVTRNYLDFLLAELIRSWGMKIVTPSLLVAGVIIDDGDEQPVNRESRKSIALPEQLDAEERS